MWQWLVGVLLGCMAGVISGLFYYFEVKKRLESHDDYLHELEVKLSDHELSSEKTFYFIKEQLFLANKYWVIEDPGQYQYQDVNGIFEVTDIYAGDGEVGVTSYEGEYFTVHYYGLIRSATDEEVKDFKAKKASHLRKKAPPIRRCRDLLNTQIIAQSTV